MKTENQVDKFLTVGGLRVLGDVQSANLQRFEKNLQETFDKTQNLTAQQKEFWKNLADDNLITPVEKKQIKQEIAIIEKTYQAIHKKAQEVSQEFNPLFTSYATAYRELKDYITELKLFDNMNENTRVNKTEFNLKFSDYYELENVVQSVFLGTPTYTMRVLASLNDLGKEGEVAIYRNTFYRWESDRWVLVSGNTYLGKLNALPSVGSYGDFFLVETDFTCYVKYKANGKFLKSNGKFLATTKKFKKGFIYKLTVQGWQIVENKNDHRYVIATEDLIEIGEKISTNLQDYITDRAPKYLGPLTEIPEEPTKDDYFTWATESTTEYVQGKVYMWDGEAWKPLDPRDKTNNQQFMTALTDILKTNATGEGYFSTVFTESLIAHTAFIEELAATKAFIEKLQSQVITLTQALNEQGQVIAGTGIIQSENYSRTNGAEGWQIRADGTADFKHVSLDYIRSANAEFTDSKFSGELDCGNLQVKETAVETVEKTYKQGATEESGWEGVVNDYWGFFGVDKDFVGERELYVTTIFGNKKRVIVNNKNVAKLKLKKTKYASGNHETEIYSIFDDGTSELVYFGKHPVQASGKQILELKIVTTGEKEKVLIFENLKQQEPITKNIVWVGTDGILRIKI